MYKLEPRSPWGRRSTLRRHVQLDLTSMADINADGGQQTVAVSYDYRHRSMSSPIWIFATITGKG